ncbi:MAG: ABC transporter ATP-binding protein [Bradyrhizobium sp.]|nr:ABC transporter ATP-binding protein [Bradyrhizobium sp.]
MSNVVLEKVSRTFGEFAAVSGVDLRVNEGEFVTLLGPSGCGKTTTLRMVAGLEQNTGGRISIGGRVVSDAARDLFVPAEHRALGMVFQSYAIWPHMSVFDNVAYPLRVRRVGRSDMRRRVLEALQLVEMADYADRPAPALSGGQQQRVAIARALVFEPALLLLDEPLSNLDARLRAQMGSEFRALQKRLGITSLYVTHDQEEAMALSDRVVVMQAGRVLQIGAPEDIYQRPASRDVANFFGSPNLLPATVVSCARLSDADFALSVRGSAWEGTCHAGEARAVGAEVLVLVRPESMRLAEGTAPATGALSGRVVQSSFHGARRAVTVEVHGSLMHAEVPATASLSEQVTFTIDEKAAWALSA